MIAWHWTGETFTPCDSVPIEDRGFRYGMALFETLRVWRSTPMFFDQHRDRLRRACAERDFRLDLRALDASFEVLRGAPDGVARIYITAGDGTVASPASGCRIYVLIEPRDPPSIEAIDLALPHESHRPLFGGLKTANYWPNIDVLQRARRTGKHEALLFNEHAELISACMANVFVVLNGTIRTPALACGARDGVMREWVLRQLSVKEGSIFVEDLQAATEVFLTSSWIGIVPAATLDGRPLPSRAVSGRLREALETMIGT